MTIKNKPILKFLITWFSFSALAALIMLSKKTLLPYAVLFIACGIVTFVFRNKLSFQDSEVSVYVISLLISFGCFIFASVNYSLYWTIYRIANFLGVSFNTTKNTVYLLLSLCSVPFVFVITKFVLKDIMNINSKVLKSNRQWTKSWILLSLIYCFAIITIVRANYIYKDDMQRILSGVTVYTRESRLLAEFVLGILETNTFFGDLSPLTQFLEMGLMALSAVIIFKVISEKEKAEFWDYIGMISFGIFPYFMEPVSFKYDGPQHGLAVLLSVLPLLYYKKDSIKYTILTAVCIVLSCSSHQVPMTVFPMATILLCLVNINTGRMNSAELKKFIFTSVCGYFSGLVFYRIFIMHPIYYATSISTVNSLGNLFPGMIKNYSDFINCIISDYNPSWLIFTVLIFICFFVTCIKNSVVGKAKSIIITGLGIILMFALSNSLYPLLENPLHHPRHIYSFGLFTGMITIAAISLCRQKGVVVKTGTLILSMCYISFALIYGNTLYYQKNYTSARVQMLVEDLNEYPVFQENQDVQVQIVGSTGCSPAVYYHSRHYPLLNRLVTNSFSEYYGEWAATDLYNLYGLNAYYDPTNQTDLSSLNMPKIKDTYYYNIYSDGSKFAVELKERSEAVWVN